MRPMLFLSFLLVAVPTSARAWQLGVGLGLSEQGDERVSSTLQMNAQWKQTVRMSISGFGYRQDPVLQRLLILSVAKPFAILKSKNLIASLGMGGVIKQTKIDQTQDSINDIGFNLGIHVGILYRLELTKAWRLVGGWEQLLMPVGFSSIFLTSARFQSLTAGVEIIL